MKRNVHFLIVMIFALSTFGFNVYSNQLPEHWVPFCDEYGDINEWYLGDRVGMLKTLARYQWSM